MTYTTGDEVAYIRDLFEKNRKAFDRYAAIIMEGRRSYDGPGMAVNVRRLKNLIRELTEQNTSGEAIQ